MTPQQIVDQILQAGGNPGRSVLALLAAGEIERAWRAASGATVNRILAGHVRQTGSQIQPGPVQNPQRGISIPAQTPLGATPSGDGGGGNLVGNVQVPDPFDTDPVNGTPGITGGNGNADGGGFWGNLPDILEGIGDLFDGDGGTTLPIGGGNGDGGPPAVIEQLPQGIRQILSTASDVADLIGNPSVVNFLRVLDPSTANSILQFFGISGSVSQLQAPGGGDDMIPTGQDGMQGAMMMEMMTDSITSKSGRAIFQAMQGNTLQNRGIWFPAQPTETPRGTEYISPPGYVTVRVSGQPYSVLRPIAKSLFGYESDSSSSTLQKADKAVRKLKKYEKDIKKILPKLGYTKSPDRLKSGPRR